VRVVWWFMVRGGLQINGQVDNAAAGARRSVADQGYCGYSVMKVVSIETRNGLSKAQRKGSNSTVV
jgi:hypothetical protein